MEKEGQVNWLSLYEKFVTVFKDHSSVAQFNWLKKPLCLSKTWTSTLYLRYIWHNLKNTEQWTDIPQFSLCAY